MTESKAPLRTPDSRIRVILVVEDEALIRLDISEHLRGCGFQVHEASNAARAIEILEAGDQGIDLVFSDLQMPGDMDGIGLSQWIETNRPGLQVLLTSGDDAKAAAASSLCEREHFFRKPYDVDNVATHIRTLIEGSPLR